MTPKPKTLRYGEALATIEQRIVDALPELIEGIISRAKEGDTKAAVYLIDRVLGKPAGLVLPPADDRRLPYDEEAFQFERDDRESQRERRQRVMGGLRLGKRGE